MKITTRVLKSSKMGPHLVLIFLERSFFYHYNAFCPWVLKARFSFWTHCWFLSILFANVFLQRNCEKDQGLGPRFPSQVGRPWHSFLKCVLTHQKPLILDYSIFRVDMSAAFLEKLWNIGIIPTKWSLENCDKVAVPNTKWGISHGWLNQVTGSSFCRRRLPVLMVRSKMAESVKSAVQVQSFKLDNCSYLNT